MDFIRVRMYVAKHIAEGSEEVTRLEYDVRMPIWYDDI